MNTLRQRTRAGLGRLLLLWFALSVGMASAAPVLHPQGMQLVCTAMGEVKLVVTTPDGAQPLHHSQVDCALCLPLSAPPPLERHTYARPQSAQAAYATTQPPAPTTHRAAAPLPPRGPPQA